MTDPGIELGIGLGLGLGENFNVNDPAIELGLTVCVTSRRYRQTNSAQELKETDRFTRLTADPCSYARLLRLCIDILGLAWEMFRDRSSMWCPDVNNSHRSISVWIKCSSRY